MIKVCLIGGGAADGKRVFPADFIVDFHLTFYPGGASGEDDHPVCQSDGLGEIVGDEQGGLSRVADNIRDVCGDGEPGLEIKGAERFVQKKEVRVDCHGADQGGALAHAAGKFRRLFVLKAVKPVILQKFQDIVRIFLCQTVGELQTKNDILVDRAPFKEMIPLQHIADF